MKLPQRFFVTGTDTGVGKTFVSAALAIGLQAHYWKPVQTGTIDGTDTNWLKSTTKLAGDRFIEEAYRLEAPLSPHAAAQLEGVHITIEKLRLPDVPSLIVEGAGGVMVPINDKQFMLDLMQHFELPVVVVARTGLGTLNHTILTVDKLRSSGIEVIGVVMNGAKNESNRQAIEKYGRVEIIAEIPQLMNVSYEELEAIFELHFAQQTPAQVPSFLQY